MRRTAAPTAMDERPRYISQAAMADRFGVTRACFSNWWRRYPPDADILPTPEPDAFIDDRPVWLESSWPKWVAWKARKDMRIIDRMRIGFSPELLNKLKYHEER